MKKVLTAALLANGLFLSSLALADDVQPSNAPEATAPAEAAGMQATDAPASAQATTEAAQKMTKKEAEKACKEDGKTGEQLKSCMKDKMGM